MGIFKKLFSGYECREKCTTVPVNDYPDVDYLSSTGAINGYRETRTSCYDICREKEE